MTSNTLTESSNLVLHNIKNSLSTVCFVNWMQAACQGNYTVTTWA